MATINSYFAVSGMTCGACSASITEQLSKAKGVSDVSVSLITEEAKVTHDRNVDTSALIQQIEDCGFEASLTKSEETGSALPANSTFITTSKFSISGMTCGACSASITAAIENLQGVTQVSVSLITEEAAVKHGESVSTDSIIQAIEDCGFEGSLIQSTASTESGSDSDLQTITTKLSISGMTCASCSSSITEALTSNNLVVSAAVSLVTEEALIVHKTSISPSELVEIIENCGFEGHIMSSMSTPDSASRPLLDEEASLQIFGISDHSDLAGLQYNIEARLNGFVGIKSYKIAFNAPANSENPVYVTDANSEAVQSLRPDHYADSGETSNVIDEVYIVYSPKLVGIRDIVDELNSINEEISFVTINSVDQASTQQLKLLSRVKDIEFWRSNFLKSILIGLPVLLISHVQNFSVFSNWMIIPGLYISSLVQFVLTYHVQFHLGAPFLKKFFKFIKNGGRNASMDVLVCISTLISFSFSVFSIILSVWYGQVQRPPKLLFETTCMLVAFISMGKWLENKAKGATSSALSKLLSLTPTNCVIIEDLESYHALMKEGKDQNSTPDFVTRDIGIDLIQNGDIAVIYPGAKIPADGKIVFGETEIDESFITGETLPVFKTIGDAVIGGSVNSAGLIHIEVSHAGKNSQLQQIISLVKDSQINKAPVQGFADYVASRFVPTVLILATTTFIVWTMICFYLHFERLPNAFKNEENGKFFVCLKLSISVIVVACPCALGLAAPTAMMVGTGVGASNGVLIKGGDVLEKASDVNIILFDKTGTLTTGGMNLTGYKVQKSSSNVTESDWWRLIGSVENNSEHPIGRTLTKAAKEKLGLFFEEDSLNTTIQDFKVMSGLGIKATVTLPSAKSYEVYVGNEKMIRQEFKKLDINLREEVNNSDDTLSFVIIDGEYSGYVSLSDKIKPNAREVIDYLQYECNIIVGIVTGDNKNAARKIGQQLGIPECNIFSEVSPINKDQVIIELRKKFGGETNVGIAFVGDGINDAPALVQADVGMAISSGSEVAIESADIVLIGGNHTKEDSSNDLKGVPIALSISSATFTRIKLNFIWAAVYNMIMLPFAMGCFLNFNLMLPPIAAAAAMALSSVSVVISSLFLKRWKPPIIGEGKSAPEEVVGAPFDLKASTLEDFNRTKRRHKFWRSLRNRPSQEQYSYEMLSSH